MLRVSLLRDMQMQAQVPLLFAGVTACQIPDVLDRQLLLRSCVPVGRTMNLRASSRTKRQLSLFVVGVFRVTAQAQSDSV